MLDDLNFHHLRYFWVTAREGNLTRASKRLRLAPSTVSAQIRRLEEVLGRDLFERRGRTLILTSHGEMVKHYADEIFALGTELISRVGADGEARHTTRLRVGMSNNFPKLVAHHLLTPATGLPHFPVHLVCGSDHPERLVAELAVHQLDLVLTDHPVGLATDVRADSRLLGESGVSIVGAPTLYERFSADFPRSLNDAPLLLPEPSSAMRNSLEGWFERAQIRPRVVGEFGDTALLKAFGQGGTGLVPIPSIVREEVCGQYGLVPLGDLPSVIERFYALTLPGKWENPAIQALLQAAARSFSDTTPLPFD